MIKICVLFILVRIILRSFQVLSMIRSLPEIRKEKYMQTQKRRSGFGSITKSAALYSYEVLIYFYNRRILLRSLIFPSALPHIRFTAPDMYPSRSYPSVIYSRQI